MTKPATTVSARGILWALERLVYAGKEPRFTIEWLKDEGHQPAVRTFLRALRLISKNDDRLVEDVRQARTNPDRLIELLGKRFWALCEDREWRTEEVEPFFGKLRLDERELEQMLELLPPVRLASSEIKANILPGLREFGLFVFLRNGLNRDWLRQRIRDLEPRRERGRRSGKRKPNPSLGTTEHEQAASAPMNEVQEQRKLGASRRGVPADGLVDLAPVEWERPFPIPLRCDERGKPTQMVALSFDPPMRQLSNEQLVQIGEYLVEYAKTTAAVAFARHSMAASPGES